MATKKKSIFVLGLILVLSLVVAACGGGNNAAPPANNTASPEASASPEATETAGGEGGDLIIATHSDAVALDPHGSNDTPSSNVAYNIYESLVVLDNNTELQPLLATEWSMVDDSTWEFKLREGVTFHDGSEFNADVVKANIERILDPVVASPRTFLFDMITEVEIVDPYTVRFHTEYPFAALPNHLAHNGGGMISLESITEDYAQIDAGQQPGSVISQNPVGTGYFKFDYWTPGQEIKVVRNDSYWGEAAKLDSVTFKVVSEALTRVSELETGYAHIIDPLSPSDISRVDGFDNAHVSRQTSTSLSYVGFNTQKEPFNDVRVRQAISMAINKEDIINGVYDNTGIPAVGPVAPGVFGYDESVTPIEYDLEGAKALLAEAGFADGFSTTIWTNDNAQRIQVAEYIQSTLSELGITVDIQVMEWGAYLDSTANGNHDMFILGWSTPTADGDYAMYALFHSSNHGTAGNRSFLSDPELDQLLEQGRMEADVAKRQELYSQAQEKLVELAPMLYIHHQEYIKGVSDLVNNFEVSLSDIMQLQNVTLSPQ